jgi:hypothetical protein
MEYRRSPDNRWGITTDQEDWFTDEAAATKKLGELRQAMESQKLTLQMPCKVAIPADCFGKDTEHPLVRMLDLPGDQPSNPEEQEHVQKMARRYVPLADLILLVGRGDDLSFLQSGGLTLPGIEDWQSVPNRFRIVTTYSFSAQSVKDLVSKNNEPVRSDFFRARLVEQIEKFDKLGIEARHLERFFPLEFGKSWIDTHKDLPEFHQKIEPMIKELKAQLLNDISSSTTPLARLRSAIDAHLVVATVKEMRLNDMNKKQDALKDILEKEFEEGKSIKKNHAECQLKYQALNQKLTALTDSILLDDLNKYGPLKDTDKSKEQDLCDLKKMESVQGFVIIINKRKKRLIEFLSENRPKSSNQASEHDCCEDDTVNNWFWIKIKLGDHRIDAGDILDRQFDRLNRKLKSYTIDTYYPSISSDYNNDIKMLGECTAKAEAELTEHARSWWLDAANKMKAVYQDDLKVLCDQSKIWRDRSEQADECVTRAEKILESHKNEIEDFNSRMNADLLASKRFKEIMDTEYLVELQGRRQTLMQDTEPVRAFVGLLAAYKSRLVRQKLLS